MKLEGKVALVTGSSSGIGKGIAVRLASEGAKVVVNYRSDPEGADDTVQKIREAGGDCHPAEGYSVKADLSELDNVRRLVTEGIDRYGQIDILVNNAGVQTGSPFTEVDEATFDLVLDVNLKGAFFTTQTVVKHLIETGRPGKIINISSVHEELPFPTYSAYCASKGGLKMLARNLAIELAPHDITVNNVAPGVIATPINSELLDNPDQLRALQQKIPLGRLGKPEDVAGLVAFLASADADYVTGATFFVDGGLTWNYDE